MRDEMQTRDRRTGREVEQTATAAAASSMLGDPRGNGQGRSAASSIAGKEASEDAWKRYGRHGAGGQP